MLNKLSSLPKKMLALYNHDYITHFVMHELCNEPLLNTARAAYFVDNPDFDCLQGVAGFCKEEAYNDSRDIWHDQQPFIDAVKKGSFNTKVKNFRDKSMKKRDKNDESAVHEIAETFHIYNPGYYAWDMKHDNHGLFIFQKNDTPAETLTVCAIVFVYLDSVPFFNAESPGSSFPLRYCMVAPPPVEM